MEIISKKIEELVAENYAYAAVLHHLGIPFYHHIDKTLEQVCLSKGLKIEQVLKNLEQLPPTPYTERALQNLSVDMLIEHLRQAHSFFIHRKMPYILHLVENYNLKTPAKYRFIIKDLQVLCPLFVEDFIHHIHEEEDTFFYHITILSQALKGNVNWGKLYYQLEKNSVQTFALKHNTHDDEMKGIREITQNYTVEPDAPLFLQVIFAELKSLENELRLHAQIEDELLFPQALILEEKVKRKIKEKVGLN
ncbi:MAG: iron-sulfur cluster repair di-iron protein [Microscillaceae bacterium]|nr:iron-sulfur cluster repair di-iron protein [Microscillaceae bacterium]MDW8459877.1 iron-sulfur cluster repair di-iron protein [Cytophagales bacterium]